MATTMLAIFKLFLYRVTGVDDIAVGVPLSDRRSADFEQLIGLFMNVVVVRTSLAASMTFFDLLDRIRRSLVDACLHQDLPYGYLVQTIQTKPPYKVVFNFMPAIPAPDFELAGTRAKRLPIYVEHKAVADLSLHVSNYSGALHCRLLSKPGLFSANYGRKFAAQIQTLTKSILDAPQSCAHEFHMQ
jgi:non-ribosomal peptide synthetase component F